MQLPALPVTLIAEPTLKCRLLAPVIPRDILAPARPLPKSLSLPFLGADNDEKFTSAPRLNQFPLCPATAHVRLRGHPDYIQSHQQCDHHHYHHHQEQKSGQA